MESEEIDQVADDSIGPLENLLEMTEAEREIRAFEEKNHQELDDSIPEQAKKSELMAEYDAIPPEVFRRTEIRDLKLVAGECILDERWYRLDHGGIPRCPVPEFMPLARKAFLQRIQKEGSYRDVMDYHDLRRLYWNKRRIGRINAKNFAWWEAVRMFPPRGNGDYEFVLVLDLPKLIVTTERRGRGRPAGTGYGSGRKKFPRPMTDETEETEEKEVKSRSSKKPEPAVAPTPAPAPVPELDLSVIPDVPEDLIRDVRWVYNNLSKKPQPKDFPSHGAWNLFAYATEFKGKFFDTMVTKVLFKRTMEDKELDGEDADPGRADVRAMLEGATEQ